MVVGFTTILVVVLVGLLLAHLRIIDARGQRVIADLSFFAALPALMVLTISRVELDRELAANLVASTASLAAVLTVYALVSWLAWRRPAGETLIGALSSGYVNAGNLGIAVTGYVLGDPSVVVPTLLLQLLLVQPASLAALDHLAARDRSRAGPARRTSPWRRVLTNPLTLASAAGVVLAATGWPLPLVVEAPLSLLAGAAIPAMLISYGISLRLNPPPGRSGHNAQVGLATTLKLGVQPVVAWLVAGSLGLEGAVLLGVVMTAALPTAQNIFLLSTRYRTGEAVAREVIAVTTLTCLPVSLLIALLLG
ncbi:AEC family transporter [Auraticoccus monumenti]|uniref:AEC family transporter n=1 Tax=Auraticoccus monumenti TaxID=675864 RepID=A0A1G6XX46_9ACTN|nr:AEC family transporter [Auraticoccus monumenti]SDD82749.1 hypothetical protein SAMN04489747_1836 [Auraticoccus monumenti]